MERLKMNIDESIVIDTKKKIMVDHVTFEKIFKEDNHIYKINFKGYQDSTQIKFDILATVMVESAFGVAFVDNIGEVPKQFRDSDDYNQARQQFYCDMILSEDRKYKSYYIVDAYYIEPGGSHAMKEEFLVSQDCFIQIELFFIYLDSFRNDFYKVFSSKKLKNLKYVTIDHVKYNCSAILDPYKTISHFTTGRGPSIFRFNIVNPRIKNGRLKDMFSSESYDELYGGDYTIVDFIYTGGIVYALYEERSRITDMYLDTKILLFKEDMLKATTFIDPSIIYSNYQELITQEEEQ